MERKATYSKKIYLLLIIFFIAIPLSLDYLQETPAGRYLCYSCRTLPALLLERTLNVVELPKTVQRWSMRLPMPIFQNSP